MQKYRKCVVSECHGIALPNDNICKNHNKESMEAKKMDIESLAKELHEAGREAVLKGKTVAKSMPEMNLVAPPKFLEWNEITEEAKEGRRIQARYLIAKFVIYPKKAKQ